MVLTRQRVNEDPLLTLDDFVVEFLNELAYCSKYRYYSTRSASSRPLLADIWIDTVIAGLRTIKLCDS